MGAVDPSGGEKYWFQGLPATLLRKEEEKTEKYWFQGLPGTGLFPAAPIVKIMADEIIGIVDSIMKRGWSIRVAVAEDVGITDALIRRASSVRIMVAEIIGITDHMNGWLTRCHSLVVGISRMIVRRLGVSRMPLRRCDKEMLP